MPQFASILQEFERYRSDRRSLVLATVVATQGSTYRKAGAMMLLDGRDAVAGLLSGGCLEGDLLIHAREVLATGLPRLVQYDLRPDHEIVWGLGAGCEGLSTIFLQRISPDNDYGSLAAIATARAEHTSVKLVTLLTRDGVVGAGSGVFAWQGESIGVAPGLDPGLAEALIRVLNAHSGDRPGVSVIKHQGQRLEVFVHPVPPPPTLLVLGAGPDTRPLARFALDLGWRVIITDHRPAYVEDGAPFPPRAEVRLGRPSDLKAQYDLAAVNAAVVMSHHFDSDLEYLRQLLASDIGYVGLLGPARRRDKLLERLGLDMDVPSLRAPIGLDLGGSIPESIALAIVAEIQAYLSERSGRALSEEARAGSV